MRYFLNGREVDYKEWLHSLESGTYIVRYEDVEIFQCECVNGQMVSFKSSQGNIVKEQSHG